MQKNNKIKFIYINQKDFVLLFPEFINSSINMKYAFSNIIYMEYGPI